MAAKSNDLAPVIGDAIYPGELLERMTGLGRAAFREARRKGLKVHYLHGRVYVIGRDWIAYCEQHGKATKDA